MSIDIQSNFSISQINEIKSAVTTSNGVDEEKFNKILNDIQTEEENLTKNYDSQKSIFPKHDFKRLAFENVINNSQSTQDSSKQVQPVNNNQVDNTTNQPNANNNTISSSNTNISSNSPQPSSFNIPSVKNISTKYDSIISEMSNKYNVPFDLIKSVINAESGFNNNSVSNTGAMGLMQLMPSTASSLGVQNAYDPRQNIEGGTKYLSQLLNRFNGNITYAVAGYNAGPGNVDKYKGIPPFQETQNYVKKVLGG